MSINILHCLTPYAALAYGSLECAFWMFLEAVA